MKRINLMYDGVQYSVGDRELSSLKDEIVNTVGSGAPRWLRVNSGEGSAQEVEILITSATQIAITPIAPSESTDDPDGPPSESNDEGSLDEKQREQ